MEPKFNSNIVELENIFNPNSVCIFTDSSCWKYKENNSVGVTAPAYMVWIGDVCVESGYNILHNASSDQGELRALLLGIAASYKYKMSGIQNVRLFSDSAYSIKSVRDWIFTWVNSTDNCGGNYLGINGCTKNQDYILDIVYTILGNGYYVELYHTKGHMNNRKHRDIKITKNVFGKQNPFMPPISTRLASRLDFCNDTVDNYSTTMLAASIGDLNYTHQNTLAVPFVYDYNKGSINMNHYLSLVNNHGYQYIESDNSSPDDWKKIAIRKD